ncbi:MAG: GTPase HflX [Lachnospiraceae bacterium]|nr:GTPase HflX [Lachnospiraceae bacterium]
MEENRDTKEKERAILAGVDLADDPHFDRAMSELKSLAEACEMVVAGIITQKLPSVNTALYMGPGKVEELKEFIDLQEADIVIFDNALSPTQLRNLQKTLDKPILDRTSLILDIFSRRAGTREAKLQVESAKLQYLLPRLVGMHEALSRQGGGSGLANKGAGEKKLELDRRKIEHRIAELRKELDVVSGERATQRKKRVRSGIPLVSLVGYTNAGKSTLMNAFLDTYGAENEKKVLEKDMLFATLDTTVRCINLPNKRSFLLSDTVGFIHSLPTMLVKAFRSTLEEAAGADLLLQVIDCSDEDCDRQIEVTEKTLKELGCGHIPMIYIFNKADLAGKEYPRIIGNNRIYMSAGRKSGIQELTELIEEALYGKDVEASYLLPYSNGAQASYLMSHAVIKETAYRENGIYVRAICKESDYGRFQEFRIGESEE